MYRAPTSEQAFALEVGSLFGAAVDADILGAILEEAGAFAAGEFSHLNRPGDTVGAQWADGMVTMPEGYKKA